VANSAQVISIIVILIGATSLLGNPGVNQTAYGLSSLGVTNATSALASGNQEMNSTASFSSNSTAFLSLGLQEKATTTLNATTNSSETLSQTNSTLEVPSISSISSTTLTTSSVTSLTNITTTSSLGNSSETNMTTGPSISLDSQSGSPGLTVHVSGTSFSLNDSSCTLSDGGAGESDICSISYGTVSASFIVADATAGSYTITVTGSPEGDYAFETFTVTSPSMSVSLSEASAPVGAPIQISGSGFPSGDSNCTLSGDIVSVPDCSVSGGQVFGSFVVANVTTGNYTVTVIGIPSGESASTNFAVTPIPSPEFQASWLMIIGSVMLGLAFLRVQKHYRPPEKDSKELNTRLMS